MLSSLGQAPHPVVLFLYINLNYLHVRFRIVWTPSMHAKLVISNLTHSTTAICV